MHVSIVILCALLVVVVNSATTVRDVTKVSKPKSAYAYLRTVQSKNSCASGTCPFWERHGRSFASLRCYSEQYRECTCLHRMCFSSCMFTRQECNKEMVSCLQQICPRCMPVSSQAMCAVYDSMAVQVADALSVFACYPCCPNLANSPSNNNNSQNGMTMMTTTTTMQPMNGGNTMTNAVAGGGQNGGIGATISNTGSNQISNGNPSNTNGNNNSFAGVFPGSGMTTFNGNMRNNSNSNNSPVQNQKLRQITRPTTRRVVTTRRTSAATSRKPTTTTRRTANVNNNNKSTVRSVVQASKKPQTTN